MASEHPPWLTRLLTDLPQLNRQLLIQPTPDRAAAVAEGFLMAVDPSEAWLEPAIRAVVERPIADHFELIARLDEVLDERRPLFERAIPEALELLAESLGCDTWQVVPMDDRGMLIESERVESQRPPSTKYDALIAHPDRLAVDLTARGTCWRLSVRRKPDAPLKADRQLSLLVTFGWDRPHILSERERRCLKLLPSLLRRTLVRRGWLNLPVHWRALRDAQSSTVQELLLRPALVAAVEGERVELRGWRDVPIVLAEGADGPFEAAYPVGHDDAVLEVRRDTPSHSRSQARFSALARRVREALRAVDELERGQQGRTLLELLQKEGTRRLVDVAALLVMNLTRAKAVQIYAVEANATGPQIRQVYRFGKGPGKARPFRADMNLGSWVLTHRRWLHYPGDGSFESTGESVEGMRCDWLSCEVEGSDERVRVRALGSDIDKDPYEPVLIVPVQLSGEHAGVYVAIGLWNAVNQPPFDAAYWAQRMRGDLGEFVASAFLRSLEVEHRQQEALLFPKLQDSFQVHESTARFRKHLLRHLAVRIGASAAAMWVEDQGASVWAPAGDVALDAHPALVEKVRQCYRSAPPRDALVLSEHTIVETDLKGGALWPTVRCVFWIETREAVAPLYFQLSDSLRLFAAALLDQHVQEHTQYLLGELHKQRLDTPTDALSYAAELITHPNVEVLLYTRDRHGQLRARGSTVIVEPGSLTDRIARGLEPGIRLIEIDSERAERLGLHREHLGRIANDIDVPSEAIRSWLCIPVEDADGGAAVGLIKLISKNSHLLSDTERRVTQLARAAQRAFAQVRQTRQAAGLNELSTELATQTSANLRKLMVTRLVRWFSTHFQVKLNVAVEAMGQLPMTKEWETFFSTSGPEAATLEARDESARQRNSSFELQDGRIYGAPLMPNPNRRVRVGGHLIISRDEPLATPLKRAADQAAREVAVLVHTEYNEHAWRRVIGRFRHALIAPVQGLQSAAKLVARRAGNVPDSLVKRVDNEVEAIQRWRSLERLYSRGALHIKMRYGQLHVLVRRAVERVRPLASERKLRVRMSLPETFPNFHFDHEAIELTLDNLLDNARKYSFYSQRIDVRLRLHAANAQLVIVNRGHRLPEGVDIFIEEERIPWPDPTRVIEGAGLGLPLARAIVRAHGGDIEPQCSPLVKESRRDDRSPWEVTFTLTLPIRGAHDARVVGR